MTRLTTILGWVTITYGCALLILDITNIIAVGILVGLAVACCVTGSIEAREKRARAQVARIVERSRTR